MNIIFNATRNSDHLPCVTFEIISYLSDTEGCEFIEKFSKMATSGDTVFFTTLCFEVLSELGIIRPLNSGEIYDLDWEYFGTMRVVNILSMDKKAIQVYIPTFDVVDSMGEAVDLQPVLLEATPEDISDDELLNYFVSRNTPQVLSAFLTASLKIAAGTSTVRFDGLLPYEVTSRAADDLWMADFVD